MKEMGGKMESLMGELREGFKKQEEKLIEIMEGMRREFNEQIREWNKEREGIKKDMEVVKSGIEIIEQKMSKEDGRLKGWGEQRGKEIMEKVSSIERREKYRT